MIWHLLAITALIFVYERIYPMPHAGSFDRAQVVRGSGSESHVAADLGSCANGFWQILRPAISPYSKE